MIRRFGFVAIGLAPFFSPAAQAAPTPRGQVIAISCSGTAVVEGRKIAKQDDLKHGQHPKACFGRMQIYDGPNKQFVVVAPSPGCPGGTAVDVYERSNAGPWYSFFETPVCGSRLSIGPRDPWGDWMLTVDGKHYDSKGQYYVPVTY
jgi:hypothetical protein